MVEVSRDEALSDEDLLVRISHQDRRAFTILMRRHGEKVRGLALGFSGRRSEADDIMQDVFVMLWQRPICGNRARRRSPPGSIAWSPIAALTTRDGNGYAPGFP